MKDSNTTNQQVTLPLMSLWKGSEFCFHDDGHIIYVKATCSGNETIFVDGEKVSEKRSFGRQSVHKFKIEKKHSDICYECNMRLLF